MDKTKQWFIDFLRGLAEHLDTNHKKGPVLRNTKQFLQTEIKIPAILSIIITFIIIYFMLIMQLGYSYGNYFAVGIMTIVLAYVFIMETRKEKSLVHDNDAIVLICLNLIIAILLLQAGQHYLSVLVFPVSAFAIMGVMLLSPRIGLIYALVLSLLAGFVSNMRFDVFMIMLGSGAIVLTPARKIRSRGDFVSAALTVTAVNIVIITMFYMLKLYSFKQYEQNLYFGILNGLFTLIILLV
ncbi:MAG: hypothetical protein LBV66_01575, partial [Elusimicrobiota bacterium]|nr:hypothetical protein [Elusimicrobiota bacterium]